MKVVLFVVLLCIFTGCASVHKNISANLDDGSTSEKLIISTQLNDTLSSEYFGMLEFTIENKTNEWITVNNISVDIENEKLRKSTKFTSGADFTVWSKAITKRNSIESYNTALAYSAILGVTTVSSSILKNKAQKDASSIAFATGLSSLSIESIASQKQRVENNNTFPDDHLLNGKIRVPPGLFSNHWLLINTTNREEDGLLSHLVVRLEYNDGSSEKFVVPIFTSTREIVRYKWQNSLQNRILVNKRNRIANRK